MARPTKKGLDYFPLDVDAASDPVIRKAIKTFKSDAWAVFTGALSYIYDKEGYYAYLDNVIYAVSDRFLISERKVTDVILYLAKHGLFILLDKDDSTVITSEGIQIRYLEARRRLNRRSPFRIDPAIWLLDEIPPEGLVSDTLENVSSEETPENDGFSHEEMSQKKRKRKSENEKEKCPVCKGTTWILTEENGIEVAKPCICREDHIKRILNRQKQKEGNRWT